MSERELLVVLVQLALLVGTARLMGAGARRLGQPAVVGELLAGILLGPSVFARLAPGAHQWVFSSEPAAETVIAAIAWIGIVLLLVVMGFETDLAIVFRFRRAALLVATGSLVVPLVATGAIGLVVAERHGGLGVPSWVVAGFFALGLSVSALPVVGKILQDLGAMRRDFGQIIVAAAMAKDAAGWLVLAVLTGIAVEGVDPARIGISFGGLALFAVGAITVGRVMLDRVFRRLLARGTGAGAAGLTVAIVAGLVGGAVTQALHLEAILGAYIAGLALSLGRYQVAAVRHLLEAVTTAFFAPVFFASSGLRVDLGLLGDGRIALLAVAAVTVGVAATVTGSAVGGRLAGLDRATSRVLGVGLAPLGVMGVVVAIIGSATGVFDETLYTVLVLAAIATSVLAPAVLRFIVPRLPTAPEESARLAWESLLDDSQILRARRVLLPTRGGLNAAYAARLVARVFGHAEVTVLAIDVPRRARWLRWRRRGDGAADPASVVAEFEGQRVRVLRRVARDPAEEILRESRLGYGLIALGASEPAPGQEAGRSVVDRVMSRSEVPVMVVHTPETPPSALPQHVVVPVTASRSARAAEELAYSVARAGGSRVTALHVINRADDAVGDTTEVAEALVGEARHLGERVGVTVDTEIRRAPSAEQEILAAVSAGGADLLVLGASGRPLTGRPFLGHRVEFMIEHAAIPVVVIALPAGPGREAR